MINLLPFVAVLSLLLPNSVTVTLPTPNNEYKSINYFCFVLKRPLRNISLAPNKQTRQYCYTETQQEVPTIGQGKSRSNPKSSPEVPSVRIVHTYEHVVDQIKTYDFYSTQLVTTLRIPHHLQTHILVY